MTSGFQPVNTEWSLSKGLGRLSLWPEEPFRAWTKPGCRFLAVESWLYKGASEAYFSDEVLEAGKVSQWLRSDPTALRDEPPAAGIKMLVIEGSSDPLDTLAASYDLKSERSVIESALDAFGLSPATGALFSLGLTAPSNTELLKLQSAAKDRSVTRYLDFPYQSIAWTSTLEGNVVYSICRDELTDSQRGSHIPKWIRKHTSSLEMPLLLPYLSCFLATDLNGVMLSNAMNETRMLEKHSGHHTWAEAENCLKNVTVGGELTVLARRACGLAAEATSRKTDALSTQIATRSIIQEFLATTKTTAAAASGGKCETSDSPELYECLKVLEGMLTSQVVFAEEIHQRALIQQTAIFQLTAQRDQGLSLEVAKNSHTTAMQSRRETASMEAIAFLTILILPGAFVATFFAMPVFDWNSTNNNTLTPRFWLYWEITVPLTVLVILVWKLWYTLKLRKFSKSTMTDMV